MVSTPAAWPASGDRLPPETRKKRLLTGATLVGGRGGAGVEGGVGVGTGAADAQVKGSRISDCRLFGAPVRRVEALVPEALQLSIPTDAWTRSANDPVAVIRPSDAVQSCQPVKSSVGNTWYSSTRSSLPSPLKS